MIAFPHRFGFTGDTGRILLVPTSDARCSWADANSLDHSVKRQITKRIRLDKFSYLFDGHLRGYQVGFVGSVNSVIAGTDGWRTTDPYVNFFGAGFSHHPHNFFRSGAAHNRIID